MTFRHPVRLGVVLLGVLLWGSVGVAEEIDVSILPDAWPSKPRVEGYEYNQKNHQAPPDFAEPKRPPSELLKISSQGNRRWRIVGVKVENDRDVMAELKIESPHFPRKKPTFVEVPPHDWATRYFAIRTPEDLRFEVTVTPKKKKDGLPPITEEAQLPENGHTFLRPEQVWYVARELDREDLNRRALRTRPVEISVRDDLGLTVPKARLLLLQKNGLMVHEGRTDENGVWQGRVSPGAFRVFAFAEVPDRTEKDSTTAVIQLPRLLFVEGTLPATGMNLAITANRIVETRVADAETRPLIPSRIWLTPGPLREAYRFEMVAAAIGNRARLESARMNPGGRFLILTTTSLPLEVAVETASEESETILLRKTLAPIAEARNEEKLYLNFDPTKSCRFFIDPASGPGPGLSSRVSLVSITGQREQIGAQTDSLHSFWVPPGEYKISLNYKLFDGSMCNFLPYTTLGVPGAMIDLTPRGPFGMTLYYKRKDGTKLQFYLAVRDATDRILRASPKPGAKIKGIFNQQTHMNEELASFRWERAGGFDRVDLEKIRYVAEVPFGEEPIQGSPTIEGLTVYNADGSSGNAPAAFGPRMLALLPEVKKSIDSCWEFLGLPDGVRRLNMEFDVFMPPGVGGTGGGGVITLDIANLFSFTTNTDLLPGAYRHELGHNLGFGHDPYMLLMPSGVDEGRFTTFGYRMLHAADFQRTHRYLERPRHLDKDPWQPGAGVYAALRLLYGADIHKRMITERRASEQTMVLHNLSSIERIAALYSLVAEENVAWVFRAHGWPVFDQRVDLGVTAVRTVKKHPRQLNFARLDGTAVRNWWTYGPVVGSGGGGSGGGGTGGGGEEPRWRSVEWPTPFIRLDENRSPVGYRQKYVLFQRIVAPKDTEAHLVCASDVQLEVRLNGTAVGFLDASPQYAQPVHDEHMLNQKRAFTVNLYKGENVIEVAANQPAGSKGFVLEFLDARGKPVRLGMNPEGPDGESVEPTRIGVRDAVYNPSFDDYPDWPVGWIQGPTEPVGGVAIALDSAGGTGRSLRVELTTAVRGGLIQRVAVEPGKKYLLTATMRTADFNGEAFVSFFPNEFHEQVGKTEPVRAPNSPWKRYKAKWFSGTTRVIYLACYVKGSAGTVWFDEIHLEETR